MKGTRLLLVMLTVMAVSTPCIGADKARSAASKHKQVVVRGNNEFALELYGQLRSGRGNLFFSPYSISTALAMVFVGAREQTEKQMADVLHFPIGGRADKAPRQLKENTLSREQFHLAFADIISSLNERGKTGAYELTVANALWGQKGWDIVTSYIRVVMLYGGEVKCVDFIRETEKTRKIINAWVEQQTNDKIKDLIQPGVLNELTRLVVTNAIYFKGNWASRFEKENTKKAPFWPRGIQKGKLPPMVDMMNQTDDFDYAENENIQVIELPYVDNELSMIILLPKEYTGLDKLEQRLTFDKLNQWLGKLHNRKVIASIPKFKLTSRFGLGDVLKTMGMTDAFGPKADFSGMGGEKNISISAVLHKAYVDVNEKGTEAAAATGVVVGITSLPPKPIVFKADHPFLFLIRDNVSGSILFIGRLVNPKP